MAAAGGLDVRMKLLCSHGGRLVPRGPGCAPRYEGGETRVLVVPRSATFRDLAARVSEMAGGAEVREIRRRLADCDDEGLEDVLVSVTCDEELAHMRHEYDHLHATRPGARFRVFVITAADGACQNQKGATTPVLPPLLPAMRRVQSEQALAARAQLHRDGEREHQRRPVAGTEERSGSWSEGFKSLVAGDPTGSCKNCTYILRTEKKSCKVI